MYCLALIRNYTMRQLFVPYFLFRVWQDSLKGGQDNTDMFYDFLDRDYYHISEYSPRAFWKGLGEYYHHT